MIKAFFNLQAEPFSKEIKTREIFPSDSFKELAGRLEYLKNHRGLMLVTGEPGTGKTISLRSFVENLSANLYSVVYLPLSTVSITDFYRQLNLKLSGELLHRKADLFNSIQTTIRDLVENRKKVPVIIIDEAHLLKPEIFYEIQIILNFDLDSTNPLIFIFAGQSFLRDKLARPVFQSLNQRFLLKYHCTPMGKQETTDYLKHRLQICGASENIFSGSASEAIFQNTQGLPRQIDNLALKAMASAVISKKKIITEEEIFEAAKEV